MYSFNFCSEDDKLVAKYLKLNEKFIPYATASTQSGNNEGGAPEKSDTQISDEGSETKDKGKNQ